MLRLRQIAVTSTLLVTTAASAADKVVRDAAIEKSLSLIAKSAVRYTTKRKCFTCHHQALPALTLSQAQSLGFKIDGAALKKQRQFTHAYFTRLKKSVAAAKGVPGGPYTTGYALWSLHAARQSQDATTDAMVSYLLQLQQPAGHWRIRTHRPPLEDSDFTATALAVKSLRLFANTKHKNDVTARITKARRWLVQGHKLAKTHEDRTFRLLGLQWSDAAKKDRTDAAKDILKRQLPDGSWRQLDDSKTSDAYATGQAIVALLRSKTVASQHKAIRRGIAWLRKAQQADGSWLVTSRSRPFQRYFESGFPHKKNQWISIAGSCWATMALMEAR